MEKKRTRLLSTWLTLIRVLHSSRSPMASRSSFQVWTLTISLNFLLLVHAAHCFNFFGVHPVDSEKGDGLKVKVKGLTSTKTQLPISHYSLEKREDDAVDIGEILLGE